jgi:hypothetical protein
LSVASVEAFLVSVPSLKIKVGKVRDGLFPALFVALKGGVATVFNCP